jgi:hypothetical protein
VVSFTTSQKLVSTLNVFKAKMMKRITAIKEYITISFFNRAKSMNRKAKPLNRMNISSNIIITLKPV